MNEATHSSYGYWGLVVINAAVFILFARSFVMLKTTRDWRSFGAFSAFIVALFAEMYGFPLTIYLMAGWLQRTFPGLDPFAHDNGHLWHTLLRMPGNPHLDSFHILSSVFIWGGFWILGSSWHVLYEAQQAKSLATTGLYASMRHPQYMAFIAILFGFLLQWPTLITLLMFPVLVVMYLQLAIAEEKVAAVAFPTEWPAYAARTPRFLPRFGSSSNQIATAAGGTS